MSKRDLETVRTEIEAKLQEIETLAIGLRTVDEAVAEILAAFDRNLAESGGIGAIHGTLFDNSGVAPFVVGGLYSENPAADAQVLFALMGREAVERQARALLTAHAKNFGPGLTKAQRTKQMADFKDELHKLELEEERTILQLEGADGFKPRRREADPVIILEAWRAHL